jgi:hypothetical protein
MDLETFIEKSVTEILNGLDKVEENSKYKAELWLHGNVPMIEMDIAVSVKEEDGKKGRAGIKVLEGDFSKTRSNEKVSRIKFGISVHEINESSRL